MGAAKAMGGQCGRYVQCKQLTVRLPAKCDEEVGHCRFTDLKLEHLIESLYIFCIMSYHSGTSRPPELQTHHTVTLCNSGDGIRQFCVLTMLVGRVHYSVCTAYWIALLFMLPP